MRVARPVSELEKSTAMYRNGLGLVEIGRFENHAGFSGVMLGKPGEHYHFEFTFCHAHPVPPNPTLEDLLVFYYPDPVEWQEACASVLSAGFSEVTSFNPYWQQRGRTFEDDDRYRVVLQQTAWSNGASS